MRSIKLELISVESVRFPCLRETSYGMVVLFSRGKTGVVVNEGDSSSCNIGYYSDVWDMTVFKMFTDQIVLDNME